MTRTRSSLCFIAATAGVFGSLYGCTNISSGYGPPPQPNPQTDTGSSSSTGGLTDCSCIPETFDNPACNACTETVTADATQCQPVSMACANDNGCKALYACTSKCATGACIDTCVGASTQAAAAELALVFACTCAKCSGTCTATTPFECALAEPDANAGDGGDAGEPGDAGDAGD